MNKAMLIGRLVANPEFKITEKEVKICRFRLAVINGRDREATFLNIIAFDVLATNCINFLQKGSLVLVDGRIEIRKVEEKEYVSVVANSIQFLKNLKEKKVENT